MTVLSDPIVTQFAVPPAAADGSMPLVVDRATGLLRQPGTTTPFVEALVAAAGEWRSLAGADTLLTETTDPADPDLIRSNRFHRWMEGAVTQQTRQIPDVPDPDLVRAQSAHDWWGAAD